jgi:mycothiol S-conjugate amidase
VLSFVPIAEGEDDLFAGIPTDIAAADALATSGDLQIAHDTRTEREA